jgi:hypothetical protein
MVYLLKDTNTFQCEVLKFCEELYRHFAGMFALLGLASCTLFMHDEEKSFLAWMKETNQAFTGDEYHLRLGIWMTNARLVRENRLSFQLGLNNLAALTPAEYKARLGLLPMVGSESKAVKFDVQYDASWDWRKKNVVHPIRDQGPCGSCWAFGCIQAAESANCLKSPPLLTLSESNLVDCCYLGCGGGLTYGAYDYVIQKQGGKFMLASDYPYKPMTGACKWDPTKGAGTISSYVTVTEFDDEDLATKCQALGPVCVSIDASHPSFQLYKSGIYYEPLCAWGFTDHAVGLMGWGVEGTTKYWILRNSWGTGWGESGYMRMIWGRNTCAITVRAYIPIP